MTTYVYIQSEPALWTVGFYRPDGVWEPESDHESPNAAAAQAAMLNGNGPGLSAEIARLREAADSLTTLLGDTNDRLTEARAQLDRFRAALAEIAALCKCRDDFCPSAIALLALGTASEGGEPR